ncbi:hypothetical protein [Kitasatospora sp. NPDC093558]|uniref:hypothetical protein n=1 Tax=Kitasatospora sp. NPDC093558 TaxID=3155201 RepID=UPI00343168CD
MDSEQTAGADGGGPAALHLQELVYFLGAHLDRAPGVLWPEHDHPAVRDRTDPGALERLAHDLSRLTGLSARCETPGPAGAGLAGGGHLLVHQTRRTALWRLRHDPDGGRAASFRWHLRPGEVLYVPARWSWHAEPAPGSRSVVTRLAAPG